LNESDSFETPIETIPVSPKAEPSIASTDAGTKSHFNDWHSKNASFSIVATLDDRSKITDSRDRQFWKQADGQAQTNEGIAIDRNETQSENANFPISRRRESDSNATL
jgi:hypothetical protein